MPIKACWSRGMSSHRVPKLNAVLQFPDIVAIGELEDLKLVLLLHVLYEKEDPRGGATKSHIYIYDWNFLPKVPQ